MIDKSDPLFYQFRFPFLLLCLIAAILVPSYFEGEAVLATVWRISFSLVMFAALVALAGTRRTLFLAGILLLVPAVITNWVPLFNDAVWVAYLDNLSSIAYFSLVAFYLGRFVFLSARVNANVLYAAMCLYLVLALVWAAIYGNLHLYYADAFEFNSPALQAMADNHNSRLGLFSYFSFVTLSTVGYGDIVPLNRVTQSWAAVEAMAGQFYIAIVMARLVSLHTAHHHRER